MAATLSYSGSRLSYSKALHVLAWVTACAVFPLIFMGGLVTSHKAGLAVPDWPNSYGYNMFLFPVSQWTGGIFYEHTHRLLGTVVGFCSILLVLQAHAPARSRATRFWIAGASSLCAVLGATMTLVLAVLPTGADGAANPLSQKLQHVVIGFLSLALIGFAAYLPRRREPRKWVRRLTWLILAAVIFQGFLGGLRVVFVNLNLAVIHGCFAQAFFCLAASLVLFTSRWWTETDGSAKRDNANSRSLVKLAVAAVAVIYLQLIAGATMRHFDAGLAIPDLPLAYGQVLPPLHSNELPAINASRAAMNDPRIHAVTMGQIWLHFTHRVGAVVVTAVLVWLIGKIHLRFRKEKAIFVPSCVLALLLLAQLTLGVLSVLLRKPAEIATSHVACGALVLLTTFVIAVRSLRLYGLPLGERAGLGDAALAPGNSSLATNPT